MLLEWDKRVMKTMGLTILGRKLCVVAFSGGVMSVTFHMTTDLRHSNNYLYRKRKYI